MPARKQCRVPRIVGRIINADDAHRAQPSQRTPGPWSHASGYQDIGPCCCAPCDDLCREAVEMQRPPAGEAPQKRAQKAIAAVSVMEIELDGLKAKIKRCAPKAGANMRPAKRS